MKVHKGVFFLVAFAREGAKNPVSPRCRIISLKTCKDSKENAKEILKKIPKEFQDILSMVFMPLIQTLGLIWTRKSHCLGIRLHIYLKKNTTECLKV